MRISQLQLSIGLRGTYLTGWNPHVIRPTADPEAPRRVGHVRAGAEDVCDIVNRRASVYDICISLNLNFPYWVILSQIARDLKYYVNIILRLPGDSSIDTSILCHYRPAYTCGSECAYRTCQHISYIHTHISYQYDWWYRQIKIMPIFTLRLVYHRLDGWWYQYWMFHYIPDIRRFVLLNIWSRSRSCIRSD